MNKCPYMSYRRKKPGAFHGSIAAATAQSFVSALPPKADTDCAGRGVRYRPKADIKRGRSSYLWEHIAQNTCYILSCSRKTATDGENLTTGCFGCERQAQCHSTITHRRKSSSFASWSSSLG